MIQRLGGRSQRAVFKLSAILILLLFLLLVVSLLAATSRAQSSVDVPYQYAKVQDSSHQNPPNKTRPRFGYSLKYIYDKHVYTGFQLRTREEGNQLRLMIEIPKPFAIDVYYDYRFQKTIYTKDVNGSQYRFGLGGRHPIRYNTVINPKDCRNKLFTDNYSLVADQAESSFQSANVSLPLAASDYGRYYCLSISLQQITGPGWRNRINKTFLVERQISSLGIGDVSAQFAGFQRTIHQNSYYSYRFERFSGQRFGNQDRDAYYQKLNQNFNLYTQMTDSKLQLQIVLPDKFKRKTIRRFDLEKVEAVIVKSQSECQRSAFRAEKHPALLPTSLSTSVLHPKDSYHSYYCLKVTARGDVKWGFDIHPYRIFFVPQMIGTSGKKTDPVWKEL